MNPDDDPYHMSHAEPTIESAYKPRAETCRALVYALYLSFVPHQRNSPTRKWVTMILFATWAVATILAQLGFGLHTPEIYWGMTVVVFSIITHLWGFEYGVLSALSGNIEPIEDDEDDE